jgi:hypothetical protein
MRTFSLSERGERLRKDLKRKEVAPAKERLGTAPCFFVSVSSFPYAPRQPMA